MKLNLPTTTLTRIVYLGLFLGVLVALFILLRTNPVEVESAAIQRGKFEERFYIDGKIRSKSKTTVVAFASGCAVRARSTQSKGQFKSKKCVDFSVNS